MRLAAYAGASTVLAAGVVVKAFHERPNFYSASVYLSNSSACRMILLNLLLLITYGLMRGLQKIVYGPLRAIEREQLWDKAWYAVTETALAMTTFRDEVGTWFFVMFVSLLAGKVWQWISESRVEALEQQPPTNPRLFHARLIISLAISEAFDLLMLRYCVNTLLEQPRPGMMVMFAFEFAVLAISSTSTAAKYILSLIEAQVVKQQTKTRVLERREELRLEREDARRQAGEDAAATAANPSEEEVNEEDIDVPGWQEKGRWLLFLDLLTDLLKLIVYMCFFSILIMFHGIPIHIIRDVFLTARSFVKRITDFLKYRNATRDMNARYPDATAEELQRDGTCIICREEMQPWQPHEHEPGQRRATRTVIDERQRPKKLPCGHVLHFGCLRSWLERQQVCPTCRSSVLGPPRTQTNADQNNQQPGQPGQRPAAGAAGGNQPGGANANPAVRPRPGLRARTFRFAGMRFTLAAGNEQQIHEALHGGPNNATPAQLNSIREAVEAARSTHSTQDQIARIERQLMRDINTLNANQEQLAYVRALQGELDRLRAAQANPGSSSAPAVPAVIPHVLPQFHFSGAGAPPGARATPTPSSMGYGGQFISAQPFPCVAAQPHLFASAAAPTVLGPGNPELPAGLTLPEGWNMLPLQRVSRPQQSASSRTTAQSVPADAVLLQAPMSSYNAAANAVQVTTTTPNPPHTTNTAAPSEQTRQAEPNVQVPASDSIMQTLPAAQTVQPQQYPGTFSWTPVAPLQGTTAAAQPSTTSHQGQGQVSSPAPHVVPEDDGPVTGLPNWELSVPTSATTTHPYHDSDVLPNWSANAPPLENAAAGSSDQPEEGMNGHADNADQNQDRKGKGRAATVEDVREDEGS